MLLRAPGATREEAYVSDLLISGEETIPRKYTAAARMILISGNMRLSYFTARRTEVCNWLGSSSDSPAASGTTLAKMVLYSEAANGDLTQVAVTANDTGLFAGTYTEYIRAVPAFTKVRGQRYAFGILVVATTLPAVPVNSAHFAHVGRSNRIMGSIGGLADVPSSIPNANVLSQSQSPFGLILP